jgi:hypothetical protein
VRCVPPDSASGDQPAGLGLRFIDLEPGERRLLERLVDEVRDGSVTEIIRRELRRGGVDLQRQLRLRPTDQKVMLASSANRAEIEGLIRDGHPSVVLRLLDNPRITPPHVRLILRDPRMTATVMIAVARVPRWFGDEECRALFCAHPQAPLREALALLPRLARARLAILAQNANLRPQIRTRARSLLSKQPRR